MQLSRGAIEPPGGFRTRDAYSPDSSFMETSRLAVHRSMLTIFPLVHLADDAVHREPVSAPNSLLTGKNTGKLARRQPFSSGCALRSGTSDELPHESEQGISRASTGKTDLRSANPSAPPSPRLTSVS